MRLVEMFNEQMQRLIKDDTATVELHRLHNEYSKELKNNKRLGVISKSYYEGALKAIDAELVKRRNENEAIGE